MCTCHTVNQNCNMQESNVRQAFMLTEKRLCAKLTIQSYIFFGFNCYKKEQWELPRTGD